jgi:TldD protein
MRDGASSEIEVGTYLFDDEGTLGTNTLVLDKGILKSGISDLLSALKLNTQPTGNGRRESFERKAYARMTNTFFEGGNDSLDNMISSIKKGYMLEGYFSGMEDPKNWGIQCVIAKGREIINGKYTGKIISPVTLTGYVPDLLKSISMVSNTPLELSGTGACGKGHKEWVKTSTGGTYIKAIGRLS